MLCLCTFEESELLEEPRSHKGVGETEEKATEQQPGGADVDRVRSGAHKTHRHLQEARRVFYTLSRNVAGTAIISTQKSCIVPYCLYTLVVRYK